MYYSYRLHIAFSLQDFLESGQIAINLQPLHPVASHHESASSRTVICQDALQVWDRKFKKIKISQLKMGPSSVIIPSWYLNRYGC